MSGSKSGEPAGPDVFLAADRALIARMREVTGHIEDMGDDERVYMLGCLTGALMRRLPSGDSVVKDPEAGDFVRLSGRIVSISEGTALVNVYRSDPPGLAVPVQCGALDHAEPVTGDDIAAGGTE